MWPGVIIGVEDERFFNKTNVGEFIEGGVLEGAAVWEGDVGYVGGFRNIDNVDEVSHAVRGFALFDD